MARFGTQTAAAVHDLLTLMGRVEERFVGGEHELDEASVLEGYR